MNHVQGLQLALDPARILRAHGLAPDLWQEQLLHSAERHILLNCSRQSGKSTTVAALALHTALFEPGSLILLLSPALRQSMELYRKVLACYRALGRPVKAQGDSQTSLELANRSRVVCLPSKEETIRGFSGVALLLIDEAARVPDDLYRSVRPMLAVSQGRLICLSTPFGKRGFFYEAWEDKGAAWHRVKIPWTQCPRIRCQFIEEETHAMGASWVRQEYCCSFEALEGLVYPDFEELAMTQAAGEAWPELVEGSASRALEGSVNRTAGRAVGGIDFGFRNPFCALWGVLDRDDVLWIGNERYLRETPIHEHAAALPRNVLWYADPAGRTEIEELRHAGLKVQAGNNDIQAGIAAVTARLRTGRLKVRGSACPNLLAEAKLYRYPSVQAGSGASEVPVDEHNHALAALRYLVSKLDSGFIARFRHLARLTQPGHGSVSYEAPCQQISQAEAGRQASRRRLRLDDDQLWSRFHP